ncbi:MAG TPA: DM13 domain-containing protein [Pilimelia sp.]|nr:DM13 domain-containing protein [Pilimelia sp.]
MIQRLLRKPVTWVVLVVLAAGFGFGLYWFQPWKLFTDNEVREALPVVAVPSPPASSPPATPALGGARLLAAGSFITHEHDTSGDVQLVQLPDGRRQLLLRGLATSDGPDLRVWLTDQPVRQGTAGWRVFDDGTWVELGRLKGNRGDQAYDVPAGVDLAGLRSVSIWCKRFAVSFGAAELRLT